MARLTVNPGDIGAEVPDQPQQGGGVGDVSGGGNRDAITQALMAQGASAGGAMQMSNPQWLAAYQGQQDPMAQYNAMFMPKGQPSGSQTDVGWMNALMPWQGGVSVGGQPGTPPSGGTPWLGGGSMARPDANYWSQQSGGGTPSGYNVFDPSTWGAGRNAYGGLHPDMRGPGDYGGMGAGFGGWGGGAPSFGAGPSNPTGSTGITNNEMGRAISDVNTQRGQPTAQNPYGYNFSPAYGYTSLYGMPNTGFDLGRFGMWGNTIDTTYDQTPQSVESFAAVAMANAAAQNAVQQGMQADNPDIGDEGEDSY